MRQDLELHAWHQHPITQRLPMLYWFQLAGCGLHQAGQRSMGCLPSIGLDSAQHPLQVCAGAPRAEAGPRDTYTWRWRQKAGGDVVMAATECRCDPKFWSWWLPPLASGTWEQKLPFKQRNICIYPVSSLWLSFKTPAFFSPGLPSSFLLGTRIPKLSLEPKFRFFGSAKGLKWELN